MKRRFPLAPVVGVGAVVIANDCVLLIRRGQEPQKGRWSLPGGALEVGETLREGIIREVEEETCLRIEPLEMIEVFDHIKREAATGRVEFHYVLVDFRCHVMRGSLQCATDASEAQWVSLDRIRTERELGLMPITMQVIEKAFLLEDREKSTRQAAAG